jgi:DNA-binding transcriptional ArsR family regulator
MTDAGDVPREELGHGLRRDIFSLLLQSGEPYTPSELGEELGESREQIHYHLSTLVQMGVVVSDNGAYRSQDIFHDPNFLAAVVGAVSSLRPLAEQLVELDEDLDESDTETVVMNCLRLSVAMEINQ